MKIETLGKKLVLVLLTFAVMIGTAHAGLLDTEIFQGNMVRVTQKYPNCIIIKSHSLDLPSDYIMITPTSRIKDIDGKVISISSLKLPCAAKIRYHVNNNKDTAQLIQLEILEYAVENSCKFKSNKPYSIQQPE